MPLRLEDLTGEQLKALPKEQTVFFIPVGGIEDHGPHLPMGLDLSEARKLCEIAAEKLEADLKEWKAVLCPAAAISVQADTTHVDLTARGYVLRDYLVDTCLGLWRVGFRHFVCFTGTTTPRQLTAIEEAGNMLRLRSRGFLGTATKGRSAATLVSAQSAMTDFADLFRAPFWPRPLEHGAARDTSVALWIHPEKVGEAHGTGDVVQPSFFTSLTQRLQRKTDSHWGNPSEASAERGELLLRERVKDLFPKFRAVWEGANPNAIFRSWYSILPPNRSFFKSWMLFLGIVVMMSLYVFLLLD